MVRKLGLVLMILVIAASLVAAACGGGGGEEATPTPPGGPGGTATPTVTASSETQPIQHNQLLAFLPDAPSGWEADNPSGGTFWINEWAWSQVANEYTNPSTDQYVDVVIQDSAYYEGFPWFAAWQHKFAFETTEGYARSATAHGYPAWETYSKPDSYGLMVFVANRFLIMVTAETKTQLEQFSNLIDYDGLAGLS